MEDAVALINSNNTEGNLSLKRGRSPDVGGSMKYQTAALFKKKERFHSPIYDAEALSYIDDINNRKKDKAALQPKLNS